MSVSGLCKALWVESENAADGMIMSYDLQRVCFATCEFACLINSKNHLRHV